jgi:DnaJ-class molecular chaperone
MATYQTIKCFKCGGKGEKIHIDPLLAVVTLGLTALIDAGNPDRCSACKGNGYIRVKIVDDEGE